MTVADVLVPNEHHAISNHHAVSYAATDCDNQQNIIHTYSITIINPLRPSDAYMRQ